MKHLIPCLFLTASATVIPAGAFSTAHAQNPAICPGLRGAARTACLRAEVERGQEQLQAIERRNQALDRGRAVTCGARSFGGYLSGGLGYVEGAERGGRPGGAAGWAVGRGAYAAGTGLLDRALRDPHPCTPRAR